MCSFNGWSNRRHQVVCFRVRPSPKLSPIVWPWVILLLPQPARPILRLTSITSTSSYFAPFWLFPSCCPSFFSVLSPFSPEFCATFDEISYFGFSLFLVGWVLAWKLVLVHVPLVQEIFGLRKKPIKPKPPQRHRYSKYYSSMSRERDAQVKSSSSW